ncbi:MAG: HlyD family efflux transporter periplasmic adaptor subunit [Polyangiales bacterium]
MKRVSQVRWIAAPLHGPIMVTVPSLRRIRRQASWVFWGAIAVAVLSVVMPWQQNVTGAGRVIAYAPFERRQMIEAPLTGRVAHWYVAEGAQIRAGDPLVELRDNDPHLLERLRAEQAAKIAARDSYKKQVDALIARLDAVRAINQEQIQSASARVRIGQETHAGARESLRAAESELHTAELNLERQRTLHEKGLASERELELATLAEATARAERDAKRAGVSAQEGGVAQAEAERARARATLDSDLRAAEASIESAKALVAATEVDLQQLAVKIARQEQQVVRAPRSGTVQRLFAYQMGDLVKEGDALATLVPETEVRAVEIWVDGNDAALITPGRRARLQFEGWPAVQFAGWPSIAVGTFAGTVAFVDAHDDGHGNFRVVITPDEGSSNWPSSRYLRQGVQVNAWVLLDRVTVGFELWRRFNGFPPALSQAPDTEHETPAVTHPIERRK